MWTTRRPTDPILNPLGFAETRGKTRPALQSLLRKVALASILLTMICHAEDWPTWQHDNRRTGASQEQLPVATLELTWTWTSSAPPQTAWSGPAKYDAYAGHRNLPSMRNYDAVFHMIAVKDRLWFGSSVDDTLYCLNAVNGDQSWAVTTGGPIRLAPTWSQGRIYFGSDDGYARCVSADNGKPVWQVSPSAGNLPVLNNGRFVSFQPCRTGIVVDEGTAWFACAMLPWKDSWLFAVDAATGRVSSDDHFKRRMKQRTIEGPPALSSGALILPQGRVAPRVFDRFTGNDLGEMAKSGGGSVVVVSVDESVFHGPASDSRKGGFRQSSGKSREMVAALGRGNALVVEEATSYMLTDTAIVATQLGTEKPLWKARCDCPFAMIKAGDTLFVGGDSVVAAFSAETGEELWRRPTRGRVFGLVAANGRLFASSDTGVIHCFSESAATHEDPITTANSGTPSREIGEPIPAIKHNRLLGHWAFQQHLVANGRLKAISGVTLELSNRGNFSRLGKHDALELNGSDESVMVAPDFKAVPHPKDAFTVATWVRIDQLQEWGGIIGALQDNGDFERGWNVGYRKDRFSMAVSSQKGPGRLTYLTAKDPFERGTWYHVAATYDGTRMQLYVDGSLTAQSSEQSGPIAYPDRAWFEIGAYHDDDEHFRMKGGIHELQLYDAALTSAEIRQQYEDSKARIPATPAKYKVASGPWLRFTDSSHAEVRWTTTTPQPTRLEYGQADFQQTWSDREPKTEHLAVMEGLRRNMVYHYRIAVPHGDGVARTAEWECDNFFNYTPTVAASSAAATALTDALPTTARKQIGMTLILGEPSTNEILSLCRLTRGRFVVAAKGQQYTRTMREALRDEGLYGHRVVIRLTEDWEAPQLPGNWANTVMVNVPATDGILRAAMHQARPDGGIVRIIDAQREWPEFSRVADTSVLEWTRPALSGAGEWSHLYGKADNSAFGGEQLAGVSTTDDLEVQWIGRPGPRYQADRSGRKPSPVSRGGQLFLQGLNRIVAVDAFNGSIQWSLEVPGLERFNMPRDCSNWCVGDKALFAVVGDECWKIDIADGTVLQRIPADNGSDTPMDWGYVAAHQNRLYGTAVRAGSSWTSFWGNADAGWYDARSGAVTHPICSDRVFCRDPDTSELLWEYKRGVVLNPTITISGDTMYFVESRSQKVIQSDDRRVADPDLWKHLVLVAVDAETGSPKWEKQIPPMESQVIFYLAHSEKQLTLVSSSDKAYAVRSLRDTDGSERWSQKTAWPGGKGDHGKAMMRPAIVGDRILLRPDVLSVTDGSILPEKMPDGHGCGTYACTADAVFYRAGTLTMWNPETKQKSTWTRLRPDCWLSSIPAGGMLLSPEGGGGCSCGSWLETSIGFIPKKLIHTAATP